MGVGSSTVAARRAKYLDLLASNSSVLINPESMAVLSCCAFKKADFTES